MSEDRPPYAGIAALPAGGERGEAEAAQWRALALALLPSVQKSALLDMLALHSNGAGVLTQSGAQVIWGKFCAPIVGPLITAGLVEQLRRDSRDGLQISYRLTPDGAQVAAAIQGAG